MTWRLLVHALRTRVWVLVWLPAVAVLSAGAFSLGLPPVYRATESLLVKPAQPLGSLDPSSAVLSSDQIMRTYARLIVQGPVLRQVSTDLNLDASTAGHLASAVRVTPEPNTTILNVTADSRDPRLAAAIANRVVRDFIDQTNVLQSKQTDQYTSKTQVQLQAVQKQISSNQARVDQLMALGAQGRTLTSDQQSELSSLQQQIAADRTTYLQISQNLAQIESTLARSADGLVVIAPAGVPSQPISPNLVTNVFAAAALGLVVAASLVVGLERLDQSVRNESQVVERIGLPVIGRIGLSDPARARSSLTVTGDSSDAEAYRALRTNVLFSTVGRATRMIVVTSALPGEGKSTTAANLAAALALAGHPTVLVDTDLRRPAQHRILKRDRSPGVTNMILQDHTDEESVRPASQVPNLWLITAGPAPPNPSELLGSGRMADVLKTLKERFAFVVIDSPPVNVVTDANILARVADATILVLEFGSTRLNAVVHAKHSLSSVGANLIGIVLNKIDDAPGAGYYYSSYRPDDSHKAPNPGPNQSVPARLKTAERE